MLGQPGRAQLGELAPGRGRLDAAPARAGLEVPSREPPRKRAAVEGDDVAEPEIDQRARDDEAAGARPGAQHDHVGLGSHVERMRHGLESGHRHGARNAALGVLGRAAHVAQRHAPAVLLPAPQRVHGYRRHARQVADAAAEGLARHLRAEDHRQPRLAPGGQAAVQRRDVAIAERDERGGGQRGSRVARAGGDLLAAVEDDQRRGAIAHQRPDAELDAATRQDGGAGNVATLGLDEVAHVEQDRRRLGGQRRNEIVDGDQAGGHARVCRSSKRAEARRRTLGRTSAEGQASAGGRKATRRRGRLMCVPSKEHGEAPRL